MNRVISEKTIIPGPDFSLHPFLEGFPLYDQRYLPRWETDNKAYYRLKGTHVIYRTQVRNLNAVGVCLYVTNDLCVNQTLEMKIYLSPRENFEAQGMVIWTQTSDRDLSCAGIILKELSQEKRNLILEHAFEISSSYREGGSEA